MCCRKALTSRAFISRSSAKRSIRVLIQNRLFVPKTRLERMFSFGEEGAGICLTTSSRTDTFVFRTKDLSGVGRFRQMLLRCHARALPVPVMGGVGKLRPITAMVADLHTRLQRCLTCFRASVSDAAHHEIAHPRRSPLAPQERGEGEASDFASTCVRRASGIPYIPMIAMSFTVPLTPAILAASVAFPVARSTL